MFLQRFTSTRAESTEEACTRSTQSSFKPPTVVKAVSEIFGSSEYRKVLVAWDVEDESVIEQAKSHYDIEVWKMSAVMGELIKEVKTRAYRDDVLRTLQLISLKVV